MAQGLTSGEQQQQQQQQAPMDSEAKGHNVAAKGKEAEVDEVMQFLQFSVKRDSSFDGTILFKFKGLDGRPESSYAVQVTDAKGAFVCQFALF